MIKHSIRSIIRTPKKSIMFFILIFMLSVFLSVGAGMYYAASNMLKDADKTFTTVVELSYLGETADNTEEFYERMNESLKSFDFDKLTKHPDVLSVNFQKSAYAYIEDKQINQKTTPLENYVIIEVSTIRRFDEAYFQGTVSKVHFGRTVRENTYVYINDMDVFGNSIGYDFIYGHRYFIVGSVSNGRNPTLIVSPGLPDGIEGFEYIVDLNENPDYFSGDEGTEMLRLIEACKVADSSLPVTMVSSLEASESYFNRQMIISKGRGFIEDEYKEDNNNVVLISKTIADFYGLDVGDKINLKLHYAKKGLGLSDYLKNYSFSHVDNYEIVGIFDNNDTDRYSIYMPVADWIQQDYHSSVLARFHVKNGKSDDFISSVSKNLLPEMKLTVYDQGYETSTKPIWELKNLSVLVLILSGLSGLAIIMLYAYLYVIKQKDTIINMLAMGAGKKRVLVYILLGSMVLMLLASITGAFMTSGFLNDLTNKVYERMSLVHNTDMRYSERAVGLKVEFSTSVRSSHWLPAFVVLAVMLAGFAVLMLFTIYIFRQDISKASSFGKNVKKVKVKTVQNIRTPIAKREKKVLFGKIRPVPLKFALVSIVRNSGRSLIVPVISLILSVFLVFLGFFSSMQKDKRAKVYDNIPVNAYLTTYKNETRDLGGLNLQYDIYRLIDPDYSYRMDADDELYASIVNEGEYTSVKAEQEREKLLESSEFFKEMYLYTAVHYEYMGISKTKDGIVNTDVPSVPHIRIHRSAFGFDWFLYAMSKMPKLAYADDIRYTPDFFDIQNFKVEFLPGYGFDSLRMNENIGIIPSRFAEEKGIKPGDTVRITAWTSIDDLGICSLIDFKVIGIYEQTWQSDTIYLPWIMSYDHNYFVDYMYPLDDDKDVDYTFNTVWNEFLPRDVRAATFTLKNTERLNKFRDYLNKQGYSEAGIIKLNRTAVVIQDKNLEETIKTLDNYIKLMDVLVPLMIILFGIIGFIVSYLLIRNRVNELAIMRSMGTGKIKVFFSYFIEQFILFFAGLIPVIIFGIIFPEYFIYYGQSLGFFILSYLTGTGLALIYLGRVDLIDILLTKE